MLRAHRLITPPLPALSFEVADGQCIAIEGPSGAGKTRLLRALADLDPCEGQVLLDGAERTEMPAHRWRKVVRYVAAEPAWWTDTPRGAFPAERDQARLTRQLASLGLSPNLLDRPISVLSTGERLRMALARAIIDTPRVLLLDEPTASLDTASAVLVEEMIRYQMLAGRSIVLASHDLQLIARVSHERLQLGRPHAVLPRAQGANV